MRSAARTTTALLRSVRTGTQRRQKAMPLIGVLGSTSRRAPAFIAAFLEGLAKTRYVEGQNAAIEYRLAEGRYDRLPSLASPTSSAATST